MYRFVTATLLHCALTVFAASANGQEQMAGERWYRTETPNFTLISDISSRQTRRFADQLETWRQVATQLLGHEQTVPTASVPNYIFVFDQQESLQNFLVGQELGIFYATPRANFMALVASDSGSLSQALHHYSHFLVRNFSDLQLPRWYEEGTAGYLARIQIDRGRAELERPSLRSYQIMADISESLTMERLLFEDRGLGSLRAIQIANLKSETLLHYLLHGYEEDVFPDRRDQLQNYLDLLLQGRNERTAFDQSFDVTTEQLDREYRRYLLSSRRPPGTITYRELVENPEFEAVRMNEDEVALLLGELALNSGRAEMAELFFSHARAVNPELARAYSGLGDALRFQDVSGRDQEIAGYFDRALELAPDDPDILLDYGEYWEAELTDCDKTYSVADRQRLIPEIKAQFERAMELVPSSPEAYLAMGQVYLFEEEDWRNGVEFQARAFELLPADSFILEQSAKYAIAAAEYERAERIIDELAQPIHFFGLPAYVNDLQQRLAAHRRGETYDACAD
jgi:tetratricopeptide (TPR) repeat protein